MALSLQEQNTVKQLNQQGYSVAEIREHIGAMRTGRESSISRYQKERATAKEQTAGNRSFWDVASNAVKGAASGAGFSALGQQQAAGEFLLSEEAIDALGNAAAHGPLGELITGTSRENIRAYIPPPERKKVGGALLQTGALLADVALAPVSLPAQIIAGGGMGYVYDVGGNLVEDTSTFTPGGGTIAGVATPPILGLVGKGFSALAKGPTRRTVAPVVEETAEQVGEQVAKTADTVPSALGQKAREIATTPSRIVGRIQEGVQEAGERAVLRQELSAPAQSALDVGLNPETVKFVDQFDETTKAAAREIVEAARNPRAGVNPQEIPGEYMVQQYDEFIQPKLRSVGERIGELSDALPNQAVDMTDSHRVLNDILRQNGIKVKHGTLIFENKSISAKQQKLIQDLYKTVTEDTVLTPRQIHEFDQRISREYREGVIQDQIENIFLRYEAQNGKIETATLDDVFQQVVRAKLYELSPEMKVANTEYAIYKGIEKNIKNTYLKQSKNLNVDPDLEITAGAALRRIFSNAQSSAEYEAVANQTDLIARQLGYEGPAPTDLAEFYLQDVKPLYPDSVQPASFEGGILGGIRGALSSVMDIGRVTNTDKQRALNELIGLGDSQPTKKAATEAAEEVLQDTDELFRKKGFIERTTEVLKDERGSVSLTGDTTQSRLGRQAGSRVDYNTLSDEGVEVVNKFLKHMDGTEKLTDFDLEVVRKQVQALADRAGDIKTTGTDKTLADQLANKYSKQISDFNPSATTKTTDLLEEARKMKAEGKIADDFIETINPNASLAERGELVKIWKSANPTLSKSVPKVVRPLDETIEDAFRNFVNDKPITINKTLYRGQGIEGGTGGADFGKGLYFSTNKKLASQYGDLQEISPSQLPKNPLRFDSATQYEGFRAELMKAIGKKREADFDGDYGKLIRSLGDYDGVIVGDGAIIVKYPENSSKFTQQELNKLWEEANQ